MGSYRATRDYSKKTYMDARVMDSYINILSYNEVKNIVKVF